MKDDLKKQIRDNLDLWSTERLLEIWLKNDRKEWSKEAFQVIRVLLKERLGEVPPHDKYQKSYESDSDKKSIIDDRKNEKEESDRQFEVTVVEAPLVRGLPGYRTRNGRTGYDPLDTRAEAARMEGLFIKNLFTLKLRTRNPFYLILMAVFGTIPFIILSGLTIIELSFSSPPNWFILIVTTPCIIPLGFLTINLVLCFVHKDKK